jgi:hypothetical protein
MIMTYEEAYKKAVEFVENSDYAEGAVNQDDNPINVHDCAMILIEWEERRQREAKQ